MWRAAVVCMVTVVGCSHSEVSFDAAVAQPDAALDLAVADLPGADAAEAPECDAQHPCRARHDCIGGTCVPTPVPCTTDDECQDDSYCSCPLGGNGHAGRCAGGHCAPWTGLPVPYDPECGRPGFEIADFRAPSVKCSWTEARGPYPGSISTPVVVDLDRDRKPEIVVITTTGQVVALAGEDCRELWRKSPPLSGFNQLAAADLDGDGFPELIVASQFNLLVLDHNGDPLAESPRFQDQLTVGLLAPPAIADVDGKAPPEIAIHGHVFRYAKGAVTELWAKQIATVNWGTISVFSDLDADGRPELITGLEIFDGLTGADESRSASRNLGVIGAFPAVADFNGDGRPDIVLVQSWKSAQSMRVIDYINNRTMFGPYTVADGGWGGPPTVADFDGDGVPDIGIASSTYYYVYALKCAAQPRPRECTGTDPGVLWQRAIYDNSSGVAGASAFDFNGDRVYEIVYRDQCWLRVFNGPDGKTLAAMPLTSSTGLEYPVVADVDADGHADIVVTVDITQPHICKDRVEGQLPLTHDATMVAGVFVLSEPRWRPARSIWHQHTHHITEIGDDDKVPVAEKPNWTTWNNFRAAVPAARPGGDLPDLTAGATSPIDNGGVDCATAERLWAQVCNRGGSAAMAGVAGTFYSSDPRMGRAAPLCTVHTRNGLQPGQCEVVSCDRPHPPGGAEDLWFRADDDGHLDDQVLECRQKNNLLFLPAYECKQVG